MENRILIESLYDMVTEYFISSTKKPFLKHHHCVFHMYVFVISTTLTFTLLQAKTTSKNLTQPHLTFELWFLSL